LLFGLLTAHFFTPSLSHLDYTDGILMGILGYLTSYYIARYGWFRKIEQKDMSKLYTTAIGAYTMLFIFTWLLVFTISLVGV